MRDAILVGLHIGFACFLLLVSFLLHGRVPGYSADESAALGFLLFFGLGVPVALVALGLCVAPILTGGRRLGTLAGALLLTAICAMVHVGAGVVASLGYLALAVWVLVTRNRATHRFG